MMPRKEFMHRVRDIMDNAQHTYCEKISMIADLYESASQSRLSCEELPGDDTLTIN